MKTLRCSDAGFDCQGEIHAETVEEVLQQAGEHARAEHNTEVSPEMAEQLKTLIRDDEAAAA
jgi:predicted small metal-binding protein